MRLATAQGFLGAGLSLFPVKADGSKAPDASVLPCLPDNRTGVLSPTWTPFQQARATADDIQRWYGGKAGDARGIALVHGKISGNLESIDCDREDAFDELRQMLNDHGRADLVEAVLTVKTPEGYHLTYRCEQPVEGNLKLAWYVEAMDEGAEGGKSFTTTAGRVFGKKKAKIETRGEGGYTIAPGSPKACHPTGKPYRLLHGDYRNLPVLSMEDRAFLHAMCRACNEVVEDEDCRRGPASNRNARPESLSGRLRPGDDFNERGADIALDLLEKNGWTVVRQKGDAFQLRRPGKSIGLSATFGYVAPGVLYVFSSSASPFESERAYSPFAVFSLLSCDGDFEEAARRLGADGFGEQAPPTTRIQVSNSNHSGGHNSNHDRYSRSAPSGNSDTSYSGVATGSGGTGANSKGYAAPPWPSAIDDAAYHGLIGELVHAVEPHTESDPIAILAQSLVSFGNVIGRSAHYRIESDRHYTNQFVGIVGRSAKGRKGTSWGNTRGVFAEVDPEWADEKIKSGLSSGEGLIHAVRDEESSASTFGMEEDKRLLVVESELATVLRVMERDGNTISARLRDAWDTGKLATLTKKDPAKATNAHISIIGHVTNQELTRYLNRTELANGFANRFLWICVQRSKLLPDGGNFLEAPERPALIYRLQEAVRFARSVERVQRDDGAASMWREVYPTLSADVPGLYGAVTSRAEAQVTRLSLLYALLDQSAVIRQEHLTAALAVWEYAEASARHIFGDALGDTDADTLLSALRESCGAGLSRTEMSARLGRNVPTDRIDRALTRLREVNYAYSEKVSNGEPGRNTEQWFAV